MTTAVVEASKAFLDAAEKLPTLYRLTAELESLVMLLEDPEVDPADLEAAMQRVAGDIEHKADGVAHIVEMLEALSVHQQNEAKRLTARAKRNQSHADRLRSYAMVCMQRLGTARLETGRYTLSIRQNPVSVNVLDAALIPSDLNRTKIIVEPDKPAILAHIKATGDPVPGVELVRGERLSIS